jgi:hypothetical protein
MNKLFVACMIAAMVAITTADAQSPRLNWYRCNTHTHTTARPNSDANGTPDFVANWYKSHGYQCIVITDHEYLTDVEPLNRDPLNRDLLNRDQGDFLVIRGQEITQIVRDASHPGGVRHAHVNGLDISRAIMPVGHPEKAAEGITMADAYQRNTSAIAAAGGIAQVNHPNLFWSVRAADLLTIAQPFLMEIWNAFPSSNNLGGEDDAGTVSPSTEGLWDDLLTRGRVVWGVASDDVHEYYKLDDRESPTPGKAWIVVRAPSLTREHVMDALRAGRFYASTGIVLDTYDQDDREIAMTFVPPTNWNTTIKLPTRFITKFIGEHGRLLAEVRGTSPRYRFKGDERYVRASITDSDGRRAWTQPVFRAINRPDAANLPRTRN